MKAITFCIAVLAATALAQAQTTVSSGGRTVVFPANSYYGGWDYPIGTSTIAEGYGRGLGAVISAKGQYNLDTSAAAINWSEARRRGIENDKFATQTYFELRDFNRQQREAEIRRERGNPDDWARYSQAAKPQRLTHGEVDAVTGQIRWPILLTSADFAQQRTALETAFAARAYHGVLGGDDFLNAARAIDDLSNGLKDRIRTLPPQQYVEAKRFLRNLAYEASLPTG